MSKAISNNPSVASLLRHLATTSSDGHVVFSDDAVKLIADVIEESENEPFALGFLCKELAQDTETWRR